MQTKSFDYLANMRVLFKKILNKLLIKDLISFVDNRYRKAYQNGLEKSDEYEEAKSLASFSPRAKLIAFYLPQFHPIEENDKWWGRGFTEWTNVTKAKPQFLDHYQPKLPTDLGFYDLRLKESISAQIELAKKFGIYGFCFHYYWFSGKRLLQKPLDLYLESADNDFPFCICWANENWTRTWDGLQKDILISQEHTLENDKNFIHDLMPYLKDKRYLKINGRPIILVYKVKLFENSKETANYWKEYCEKNEIGVPYLVAVESSEILNPNDFDFDATVQFPPLEKKYEMINYKMKFLNRNFKGGVYDYLDLKTKFSQNRGKSFRQFKAVVPGWDNTARRGGRGSIFINSSPQNYGAWLNEIIQEEVRNFPYEERMVFINAWNEWAEGAYLEPDRKYGYAFLNKTLEEVAEKEIAIIIHAYYKDIFGEILELVSKIQSINLKLIVTTTRENFSDVEKALIAFKLNFELIALENKGRDILPFLKILQSERLGGYKYFLKLHTKKSPHRIDGERWRNEMLGTLLKEEFLLNSIEFCERNAKIGMVGPIGHILPMSYYWGSNQEKILDAAFKLGYTKDDLLKLKFVAGSMFFGRKDAFSPLLDLQFTDSDFEEELGQVDGTLAHAIERIFALVIKKQGYQIIDSNFRIPKHQKRYSFAKKS